MSNVEDNNDNSSSAAEQVLSQRLAALPRQRQSSVDLWPQIQARLGPQQQVGPEVAEKMPESRPGNRLVKILGTWPGQWLPRAAAAVFVLAILGSLIINLSGETQQPDDFQTIASRSGNLPLLSASAELEYSGALQNLLPLTVNAPDAQPGSLLADYVQSLQVVRSATVAVRLALESDPGSRYLNNMLTDLQLRQLNVLKEMAREADQQISQNSHSFINHSISWSTT